MDERLYWLAFAVFPGVGPGRFGKLLSRFALASVVWCAPIEELEQVLGKKLAAEFVAFRKTFFPEEYAERLQRAEVGFVTLSDENYPKLLAKSKNPPFVLFYKGVLDSALPRSNNTLIGIVGTRKVTEYGREITQLFTKELVAAGCVIVSGLAFGVDAVAHQTTLEQQGRTIAVLGSGIDYCTPRENLALYNSIIAHGGVIVSESGLGVTPTKGSFPSRNRIIAGLSDAVLVTEGAADSGALITAKDALANGRKVFAVPGPITSSLSAGPYQLIKDGARLVTSAGEVLDDLKLPTSLKLRGTSRRAKGDTKEEQAIFDLLQNEALHFDELVKRTQIVSSELGSLLSFMEVKGTIVSLEAGFFRLHE